MPKIRARVLIAALLLLLVGAATYLVLAPGQRQCGDGRGSDYFNGGSGTDTITYSCATHPILVDLADGLARGADIGFDEVVSFEVVRAGLGDDLLMGSARSETLDGAAGNDRLMGRGGADILTGGSGADLFMFTARVDEADIDQISDFDPTVDTLGLLGAEHPALTAPFGTTQLALGEASATSATRIVYNPLDGHLSYDPDGTGPSPAEKFAIVSTRPPALDPSHFQIVLEISLPQ